MSTLFFMHSRQSCSAQAVNYSDLILCEYMQNMVWVNVQLDWRHLMLMVYCSNVYLLKTAVVAQCAALL